MKKVISLLLATTFLVFALASCNGEGNTTTEPSRTTSNTTISGDETTNGTVVPSIESNLTPGSIDFELVTSSTDNMIAIKELKDNIKNLVIGDTYVDEKGASYTVYSVGIGPGYKVCGEYNYSVESLVIMGGKTKKVEEGAFQLCTNLTAVSIGEGVKSIGDIAFFGCSAIESLTLPSTLETIGTTTFWGLTNLKELVIPENVTEIGIEAFSNCTSLEKVTMPSRFNDEKTLKNIFLNQYKTIEFTFVD